MTDEVWVAVNCKSASPALHAVSDPSECPILLGSDVRLDRKPLSVLPDWRRTWCSRCSADRRRETA